MDLLFPLFFQRTLPNILFQSIGKYEFKKSMKKTWICFAFHVYYLTAFFGSHFRAVCVNLIQGDLRNGNCAEWTIAME